MALITHIFRSGAFRDHRTDSVSTHGSTRASTRRPRLRPVVIPRVGDGGKVVIVGVFGILINVTTLVWLLAEVAMQRRQYLMGGKAVRTEWRSLGAVIGTVLLGEVLAVVARSAVPGADFGGSAVLTVALVVMWAGIAFRLWAIHTLGRFFRGVVHIQADHQVVTAGPYRVLRHPSYAGAMVAVLGLALAFENTVSLVALFGCALAGVLYRIRVEEQVLSSALGDAYTAYAAGTRRLVPGVW
jgi:protein-S-isoprenylcysteine O-methyltransferase Ste14